MGRNSLKNGRLNKNINITKRKEQEVVVDSIKCDHRGQALGFETFECGLSAGAENAETWKFIS